MKESLSRARKFGFTLVEVLVTTVVVGTMAAVVIPAMIKLAPAGDPARVAADLHSVKTAIEVFAQHLRPLMPGDIEDLIHRPKDANPSPADPDKSLDGIAYRQADMDKWKGPYVAWTALVTGRSSINATLIQSGLGAQIHTVLYRCPVASTDYAAGTNDTPCTSSHETNGNIENAYVAVKISGIPPAASEFMSLNDIVDGRGEANPGSNGMLRQNAQSMVFFFVAPYTAP